MRKKLLVISYFLLLIPFSFIDKGIVAQNVEQNTTYLLYEIIKNRQSHNYAEAIDLSQHALFIDPENSDILYELFLINSAYNNHEKAFYYLKLAYKKNPNNKYYKESLIRYYDAFNQQEEAINLTLELIKDEPYNETYIQILAQLYRKIGKHKEAYKQLEKLEKIKGVKLDLGLEKLALLYELNQERKIIPELKKLINYYPDNTLLFIQLGAKYLAQKKDKKSNEAFLYAINKTPKCEYTIDAVEFLARNYIIQNDTLKSDSLIYATFADKDILPASKKLILFALIENKPEKVDIGFDILLKQHNENDEILTSFAKYLLLFKKDTVESIKYFHKSLEANPHQSEIWTELIFLEPKNQEKNINEALKYNPKEDSFHYMNATILSSKEEYEKALVAINTAINEATKTSETALSVYWGHKGDLLYLLGKEEEAFLSFEKAINYNQSNHLVLNNYAYFLALKNQDLQKAEEMSSNAVKLMPSNATYLDTYAWILFLREQYSLALFYIEKAITKEDGQHSEIYDHYGDILFKKGETEKAIEAWNKAIKLGDNSQTIKDKILKYTNENKK